MLFQSFVELLFLIKVRSSKVVDNEAVRQEKEKNSSAEKKERKRNASQVLTVSIIISSKAETLSNELILTLKNNQL